MLEATRHPVIIYHIPKYAVHVPEEVVTDLPVWGAKDSSESEYTEALLRANEVCSLGPKTTSGRS